MMAPTSAQTTFRVRGLPPGCSKAEAETLVRSSLQMESESSIRVFVRSLAQASGSNELTATVDFSTLPSAIASTADARYQQDFPVDRGEQDPLYLTFDTHFDGWTPLHSTPDAQGKIEQVAQPLRTTPRRRRFLTPAQYHRRVRSRRTCLRFVPRTRR